MEILYGANKRCYNVHAFGYNSAESEPIKMESGTVWAKCWGLALVDFTTVWETAEIFWGK